MVIYLANRQGKIWQGGNKTRDNAKQFRLELKQKIEVIGRVNAFQIFIEAEKLNRCKSLNYLELLPGFEVL